MTYSQSAGIRSIRQGAVSAIALLTVTCSAPPPPVPAHPTESRTTEQSNLLLFPVSEAESLLGRPVHVTDDGAWTISDARASGCDVGVRREKSSFHTARQVDVHSMTSLTGGYAKLVALNAQWGRQNTAEIDIQNTQVLKADLRGSCGDLVVDSVFVGHGRRRLLANADYKMNGSAALGGVTPSGSTGGGAKVVDELLWNDEQAYGFTYKRSASSRPIELHVFIPSIVTEGDEVDVRFESKQPLFLVVYYLDSEQKADVLWPSNEEPEPTVAPNQPATLPSQREKALGFHLRAALGKSNERTREALVIYAFAERADFERLKPGAGTVNADGAAYAAELTKTLESVPISRWTRAVLSYVIEPRR